jgi:pimeloyl-ACP methyl ester carboxylesterase
LPGLLRQSDAMRLNFHAQGEGVPLIILHGFLGSMDNWRAMSRRLAAHFRVYCLDLRNHGASPHSSIMNYAAMADDVHEFFINQNIDRANLLGHSMGGKVAMQFTADNPQAVTKLIVVDIAPKKYPPTHMPLLAALSGLQLGNYRSYSDVDRALQGQIPEAPVRQFLIKNLARGADNLLLAHRLGPNHRELRHAHPSRKHRCCHCESDPINTRRSVRFRRQYRHCGDPPGVSQCRDRYHRELRSLDPYRRSRRVL